MENKARQHRAAEFHRFEIRKNFSVLTRKLFCQPQTLRVLIKVLLCQILPKPEFRVTMK